MNLVETVVAAVSPHPAVESIELVGSRAEGRATKWSDWDFAVRARDFGAVADALPGLLEPLDPLVQQWDRLSDQYCWMLILRGPAKVDFIFPDEPYAKRGPWQPGPDTLAGIDDHFWDWMLWLRAKEAAGKEERVASELEKLFGNLLGPLGVEAPPSSIAEAVDSYLTARDRAERRFGRVVSRDVEQAVAPSLRSPD
jgi:predicted nucleotidyltransferase